MSNEQKDPQPKEKNSQVAAWLAIGAGVGVSLGIVFHNIPMGITIGAALGLIFGAVISLQHKK